MVMLHRKMSKSMNKNPNRKILTLFTSKTQDQFTKVLDIE